MIKQIILISIILLSVGLVNAGEIVTVSGETVYLYGTIDKTLFMKGLVVGQNVSIHSLLILMNPHISVELSK
jgi:hypothetical protein